MPIKLFLNGEDFDLEATRVMGVALEMACVALRTGDCADDVKQAIANKIIALAKAGERNPDILCEQVLKGIRRPQMRRSRHSAARTALSSCSARRAASGVVGASKGIRKTGFMEYRGLGISLIPAWYRPTLSRFPVSWFPRRSACRTGPAIPAGACRRGQRDGPSSWGRRQPR